jgi:hypothetical protein
VVAVVAAALTIAGCAANPSGEAADDTTTSTASTTGTTATSAGSATTAVTSASTSSSTVGTTTTGAAATSTSGPGTSASTASTSTTGQGTTTTAETIPCDLDLIVEQTDTAYENTLQGDLRCAEGWASWVGRSDPPDANDGYFAVAVYDAGSWTLVNLGTSGVCEDGGVPERLWADLDCIE